MQITLLDGGMGTVLAEHGISAHKKPELLNIENPELITSVHKSYLDAGSQIIYTNTFGANRFKLESSQLVGRVINAGIKCAEDAINSTPNPKDRKIFLDIGPIGQLLQPSGTLSFEDAYDIFKEIVLFGKDRVDGVIIETMTDLYEARAALLACKENCDLPVYCTMTFDKGGRTFTGVSVATMATTLVSLGADAVGFNCSLGPSEIMPLAKELAEYAEVPLIIKPNAGLPDPVTGEYSLDADTFAEQISEFYALGFTVFGGCCGTSPLFIDKLSRKLKSLKNISVNKSEKKYGICSNTDFVDFSQPRICGERLNPTGKKRLKEALISQDTGYIISQAIEQISAGADVLDVNVGVPGIDEVKTLTNVVKTLQGVISVPLMLDSGNPAALESALRILGGKAIVNSVNAKSESLFTILPIVKKYGAAVVGLALDENGIPKTAQARINCINKIINACEKYGIKKSDIFIDCLTLTVSAEQEQAKETLAALEYVTETLGVKSVLGVSNISFGLPERENINTSFLTIALSKGLTLPIMNPNIKAMKNAVNSFKAVYGYDKDCLNYINENAGVEKSALPEKQVGVSDLANAVKTGNKEYSAKFAAEMLIDTDPMSLINNVLIPSLNEVGEDFDKGKIYLPQLLLAAGAAGAAFDEVKKKLEKTGSVLNSTRGTIVLATVKGDIHDIGKNIVRVLLESYNFRVIDLGRDVAPEVIADAIKKNNADLCGLSALMTTTLPAMEETVKLIRKLGLRCRIMVGGAVLTEEYAKSIGADFYSKTAKDGVTYANA
ncbi:MAG: homocysteine S-methyltransferase family protein [Ruminococcus sp.]|jgi:5-methyltetrahydrofolate--homocysteine methyltransferase|nr:homocysteine S-methyltransferase family protein [Ruminococcus sp.]